MLNDQFSGQLIKKNKNPELAPFIIQKGRYAEILSIMFLLPVILSAVFVLFLLLFPKALPIEIYISVVLVILIIAFLIGFLTFRSLRAFQLKGSLVNSLTLLLEKSLLRFQSFLFPILIVLLFASILIPGTNGSTTGNNADSYSLLLSFAGIIIPFIGLIPTANIFFDYIDENNNKIHELSDKPISENFRAELKNIGKEIGFKDVKVRLGDMFPDNYSNHSWSVVQSGIVLMVYSSITFSKATELQNTILMTRDLFRVKNRQIGKFYLISFLRNFFYMISFILVGLIIISIIKPSWNNWIPLINSSEIVLWAFLVVISFLGSFFFKIYLDSATLINELKADKEAIEFLKNRNIDMFEIKQALFHVSKLNPLMNETKGLDFRRSSIESIFPTEKKQQKTGITWEDI